MRWWGRYQNGKAGKAETINFTRPDVIRGMGGFDYVGYILCSADCYNRGAQVCAALWVKVCLGTVCCLVLRQLARTWCASSTADRTLCLHSWLHSENSFDKWVKSLDRPGR